MINGKAMGLKWLTTILCIASINTLQAQLIPTTGVTNSTYVFLRRMHRKNYARWQISNFQTWDPNSLAAMNGYMNWGLYRPDASVADVIARIIYHDDVRIYQIQP